VAISAPALAELGAADVVFGGAAVVEVAPVAPALGVVDAGGLGFTTVVFAAAVLAGGAIGGGTLTVTLLGDAAAPFGGKLPAGCAALRGATLGAGGDTDARGILVDDGCSAARCPLGTAGDDGERLSLCTGRGRSA
jgi:hypothetical protein